MTDPTLMKLAASYAKRRASRPGAKAKFADPSVMASFLRFLDYAGTAVAKKDYAAAQDFYNQATKMMTAHPDLNRAGSSTRERWLDIGERIKKAKSSRPGAKAKFAANPIADLTAALKAATAAIKADPLLSSALPMSEMSQWSAAIKNGTISEQVAVAAAMRVRAALQAAKSASGPTKVASPKKPAVAGQSVIGRAMDRLRTAASTITTKTVDPTSQEYKDALAQAKEQAKQALGAYAAAKAAHNTALGRLDAYVTAAAKTISAATSVRDVQHYLAAVQDATRTRSVAARSMPTPFARPGAKAKSTHAASGIDKLVEGIEDRWERIYHAQLKLASIINKAANATRNAPLGVEWQKAYKDLTEVMAMHDRYEGVHPAYSDVAGWQKLGQITNDLIKKINAINANVFNLIAKTKASGIKMSRNNDKTAFSNEDEIDWYAKQVWSETAIIDDIIKKIKPMIAKGVKATEANPELAKLWAKTINDFQRIVEKTKTLEYNFGPASNTVGSWRAEANRRTKMLVTVSDLQKKVQELAQKTVAAGVRMARPGTKSIHAASGNAQKRDALLKALQPLIAQSDTLGQRLNTRTDSEGRKLAAQAHDVWTTAWRLEESLAAAYLDDSATAGKIAKAAATIENLKSKLAAVTAKAKQAGGKTDAAGMVKNIQVANHRVIDKLLAAIDAAIAKAPKTEVPRLKQYRETIVHRGEMSDELPWVTQGMIGRDAIAAAKDEQAKIAKMQAEVTAMLKALSFGRIGTKSTHAQLPDQTLEAARQPGGGAHSEAVSRKIKTLIDEGKPQDQAVAIALDLERRGEL